MTSQPNTQSEKCSGNEEESSPDIFQPEGAIDREEKVPGRVREQWLAAIITLAQSELNVEQGCDLVHVWFEAMMKESNIVSIFGVQESHAEDRNDNSPGKHLHICVWVKIKMVFLGGGGPQLREFAPKGCCVNIQKIGTSGRRIEMDVANTAAYFMKQLHPNYNPNVALCEDDWKSLLVLPRERFDEMVEAKGLQAAYGGDWEQVWPDIIGPMRTSGPQTRAEISDAAQLRRVAEEARRVARQAARNEKDKNKTSRGQIVIQGVQWLTECEGNWGRLLKEHFTDPKFGSSLPFYEREIVRTWASLAHYGLDSAEDVTHEMVLPGEIRGSTKTLMLHTKPSALEKKNGVYFWGEADTGKSTFVKWWCQKRGLTVTRVPVGTNKLPADAVNNRVIYVDDLAKYSPETPISYSTLEGWTNGGMLISVYKEGTTIAPGIVLVTANYHPFDHPNSPFRDLGDVKRAAFDARFHVVHVTKNLMEWLESTGQKLPLKRPRASGPKAPAKKVKVAKAPEVKRTGVSTAMRMINEEDDLAYGVFSDFKTPEQLAQPSYHTPEHVDLTQDDDIVDHTQVEPVRFRGLLDEDPDDDFI